MTVSGAAEWYVFSSGRRRGPYALAALEEQLDQDVEGWDAFVWRPGMFDWQAAREVKSLAPSRTADRSASAVVRRSVVTPAPLRVVGTPAERQLPERYEVQKVIAVGGMGALLLATDNQVTGRPVVIKLVNRDNEGNAAVLQQFRREVAFTSRFSHPNIIKVYDYGTLTLADGQQQHFYTMPFVEGPGGKARTYDDALGQLRLVERIEILRAAARGVVHAHDQNLWHRDLKPQNILLGNAGDVYVIDWGLVSVEPGATYKYDSLPALSNSNLKLSDQQRMDMMMSQTRGAVTQSTDLIMGTPAYMAPEQLAADPDAGRKADAWALGVMLYEALVDRHPYLARDSDELAPSSAMALLTRLMTGAIPHACAIAPSAPRELAELAVQLLSLSPEQRPDLHTFIEVTSHWLHAASEATRSLPFMPALDSGRPESSASTPPPPFPKLAAPPPLPRTEPLKPRASAPPERPNPSVRAGRARLAMSLLAAVLVAGVAAYVRSSSSKSAAAVAAPLGAQAQAENPVATSMPDPAQALESQRARSQPEQHPAGAQAPSGTGLAVSAPGTDGVAHEPSQEPSMASAERRASALTVGADWAPVRSAPAPDASVVCSLPRGTALPVLDQHAYMSHGRIAHWFVIRCNAETTGWVHENHLASIAP
jgi:serine/threonine protein kinase